MTTNDIARGLENVTVAATSVSHIDAQAGRLLYRGYDAVELALHRTFEDVWHLLVRGELPGDGGFARRTARLRTSPLPPPTMRVLAGRGAGAARRREPPITADPTLGHVANHDDGTFMLTLQAAIAATGAAWGVRPWYVATPFAPTRDAGAEDGAAALDRRAGSEDRLIARERRVRAADPLAIAIRLASVMPTLVAALWRLRTGRAPIPPDPTLGHVANYLWMLEGARPTAERVRGLERYLVLAAEHGMNASTFTARVIASTGADVVAAVTGAAGAFAGPLHGGAPSHVLDMLDAIGRIDRAHGWVRDALAGGVRIMGFGHRVYRADDPRSVCLRATAEELGGPRIALATEVERVVLAALHAWKPDRALFTNVEFYAAVVLERIGIPRPLFTPTFCIARTIGWTAHVLEQIADNRLIRPAAAYVGPRARRLAASAA